MDPKGTRRLRRYAAEFVVIFLGVSLSFLAENVREARADRAAERASLVRLVRDMESDLADFPGNLERAHEGIAAIGWIQTAQDGALPAKDSLEHYLEGILVCSAMAANSSEYESLKASGSLRLIRDVEFRQALTENYERYQALSQQHVTDCEAQLDPLEPIADQIRIRSDRSVEIVGDVEAIMTNGRFFLALSGVRGRRGAIAGNNRSRIDALEKLRARALELLGEF